MKKLLIAAISMSAMLAVSLLISNASSADSKGEKPRPPADLFKGLGDPKESSPYAQAPEPYPRPRKAATDAELGGLVAGPPESSIPALGEQYKKAIDDAVAAGQLKPEQAEELSREYATFIAIRKARLDVMRAIHLLEGIQTNDTKQGQEAKRLKDALQSALQVEQAPAPARFHSPVPGTPAPISIPGPVSSPAR